MTTTSSSGLDAAYRSLPSGARVLYRQLGVLPSSRFDVHGVAAVAALSPLTAGQTLMPLRDANLLNEEDTAGGGWCFRFTAGARRHALGLAEIHDSEHVRTRTLRRLCDWVLWTASGAQERLMPDQVVGPRTYARRPTSLPPFVTESGALAWLREHQGDLLATVRAAADAGWYSTGWQLVAAHWPLFVYAHPYELWIETHRIGLDCARRAGNPVAECQMLSAGAIGLSNSGEVEEAIEWYTAGLSAARTRHDARGTGEAHLGLARCRLNLHEPQHAEAHVREAIACWTSCGYSHGVARALIVYGEITVSRDSLPEAIGLFTDAQRRSNALGDPYGAARALALRGRAHSLGGDHDAGLSDLHQALAVIDEEGAQRWQARVRHLLGKAFAAAGDTLSASRHLKEAAECYHPIDPAAAAAVRQDLRML